MLLRDITSGLDPLRILGDTGIYIEDICYDSRKVSTGSVFVCLKGSQLDGHGFVQMALQSGAVAIVASDEITVPSFVTVVYVDDTRKALALMSVEFFADPASKLTTIGITGTKGKTTTAFMIQSIMQSAGIKTGIIGTLGVIVDGETIKTNNTTPESYEIQKFLRLMVDRGCKCAVMEASSLGLKLHRMDGFTFDCGVFTNFSHDHIGGDEHPDMQDYLQCKAILFKRCRIGIVNLDDPYCYDILTGHSCDLISYGFSDNADFVASNATLISKPGSLGVSFLLSGRLNLPIDVNIPGKFSVYNALSALSVCYALDVPKEAILRGLMSVFVKGRVESVHVPGDFTLLIDYAHNALSMENILSTLREYNPSRIITLFGAGGNRPKVRRFEMGDVAGRLSDLSVITADNSRFENVMDIIADIESAMIRTGGQYVVIPDRREAIRYCISTACSNDIVLFAGKGHEDYQEICGVKYHFDEREVIAQIISELF